MYRNRCFVILCLLLTCLILAGCRSGNAPVESELQASNAVPEDDSIPAATEPPADEPAGTSEELGLFAFGEQVFTAEGTAAEDYLVDGEGNIVDRDGKTVISAADVKQYLFVSEISVSPETELKKEAPSSSLENGAVAIEPVSFAITMKASPVGAIRKVVRLESADPFTAFFPADENTETLAETNEIPETGELASAEFQLSEDGELTVYVTVRFDGEVTITARNEFGAVIGEFVLEVKTAEEQPEAVDVPADAADEKHEEAEAGSASGDKSETSEIKQETTEPKQEKPEHVHEFEDQVISATESAGGYTIHSCKSCGYSYRDSFTEKLPCSHEYTETVIPATTSSGGYTLHACRKCGYSYRDNETKPLACTHSDYTTTVVPATCETGGHTAHECRNCGYTWTDTPTAALGHAWDAGTVTRAASCAVDGVRTYTCSRCGAVRTETVQATGHKWDAGTVTSEPTCSADGVRTKTCTVCGETVTEAIPATGNHSYTDTVFVPTCTEDGFTMHTCSVCGYYYYDNVVPNLGGHDYHRETIQITHTEVHTFCSTCGMQLTGMSEDQVTAHVFSHIDDPNAGGYYSASVPVVEEKEVMVCSKCGDWYE